MNPEISPKLLGYLRSWHDTATKRKIKAGYNVDLPFDAFLALFSTRQLASLQRAIDADRIRYLQSETNGMAYVLTWKSYAACSTRQFNGDTACVCSRWKSAQINLPQRGDELRPDHRASIGASLTGKPKTDDHRKAISDGSKGGKKAAWSEERKDARRALRQRQEAKKRGGA